MTTKRGQDTSISTLSDLRSLLLSADHPPQEAQQMGSTAQSQVPSFAQLAFDLDSLEKYVGEMLPNQGSER